MSGSDSADDEVDVTIWSGRLRSSPTPRDPVADEEGDAAPDDATILAPRRSAAPDDATRIARAAETRREAAILGRSADPRAAEPPEDETIRAPRRASDPAAVASAPVLRVRDRSQHPSPLDPRTDPSRPVRVPAAGEREIYKPRADAPVVTARAAPAPRAPQAVVDVAAGEAARARRRRRRAIIAGVVAGALVLASIIVILVLVTTGA
ncbi:hypothetical protein [Microbacterium sp. P04]|uniref:hypothetical protein n=1 Tax=Microbacterium sp. P04 TaxID=3366947 RepID=UPI003746D312